jgi:hypothetical protein
MLGIITSEELEKRYQDLTYVLEKEIIGEINRTFDNTVPQTCDEVLVRRRYDPFEGSGKYYLNISKSFAEKVENMLGIAQIINSEYAPKFQDLSKKAWEAYEYLKKGLEVHKKRLAFLLKLS